MFTCCNGVFDGSYFISVFIGNVPNPDHCICNRFSCTCINDKPFDPNMGLNQLIDKPIKII